MIHNNHSGINSTRDVFNSLKVKSNLLSSKQKKQLHHDGYLVLTSPVNPIYKEPRRAIWKPITYSLSIIPSKKGLIFGKINNVSKNANNHFEAASKLKTNPFL